MKTKVSRHRFAASLFASAWRATFALGFCIGAKRVPLSRIRISDALSYRDEFAGFAGRAGPAEAVAACADGFSL
jgi:hypothetical protein